MFMQRNGRFSSGFHGFEPRNGCFFTYSYRFEGDLEDYHQRQKMYREQKEISGARDGFKEAGKSLVTGLDGALEPWLQADFMITIAIYGSNTMMYSRM